MCIRVRGKNDILYFQFDENVVFNDLYEELKKLLGLPAFNKNGYYSKGFFDFGSRILYEIEIENILDVLINHKNLLLVGINHPENSQKYTKVVHTTIHSGEVVEIYEDVVFVGKINKGGLLKSLGNVYIVGNVLGDIELICRSSKIYGDSFMGANIKIFNKNIKNLTNFSASSIYYEDGKIIIDNGVEHNV